MKVGKIITTIETNELEITGATLLTVNEAFELPSRLCEWKNWWWLRDPGFAPDCAAYVEFNGRVQYGGCGVHYGGTAIRPALKIENLDSSNFKIGDVFIFGEKRFEIVSETIAFCLESIGVCAFRADWEAADANDYEKSDVKKIVDKWFMEATK